MITSINEVVLKGHPISSGIAIGSPYFFNHGEHRILELSIPFEQIDKEIDRYREALTQTKLDIKRLQKQLEMETATAGISILESQFEMLNDPLLTVEIENIIRFRQTNAESVLREALKKYEEHFHSIENAFFLDRFKDLQDLSLRIFSFLHETGHCSVKNIPPQSILCSEKLTAADAASANPEQVIAFLTNSGSSATHAAIIAKGKGIPFVTNINLETIRNIKTELIIVDGHLGRVILNPAKETLKDYLSQKKRLDTQSKKLQKESKKTTKTIDGYSIHLYSNLDSIDQITKVQKFGGEGIGLFRSEYLFQSQSAPPSEEEQYHIYSTMLKTMGSSPVVIRTFDLEGDKSSFLENKPTSGTNFTTLDTYKEELFKIQLRAILRASINGNARILFPMISTLEDLLKAKERLQIIRKELDLFHPLKIGCMIEVPSAAMTIDYFIKECDFFSIGTNDLIRHTLGIDRGCPKMNKHFDLLDPSVIRLIQLISHEANSAQIPVTICGEIAANPYFTPLLLGIGIQELSMSPHHLPTVKDTIHKTNLKEAVILAERVSYLKSAQEVADFLKDHHQTKSLFSN